MVVNSPISKSLIPCSPQQHPAMEVDEARAHRISGMSFLKGQVEGEVLRDRGKFCAACVIDCLREFIAYV